MCPSRNEKIVRMLQELMRVLHVVQDHKAVSAAGNEKASYSKLRQPLIKHSKRAHGWGHFAAGVIQRYIPLHFLSHTCCQPLRGHKTRKDSSVSVVSYKEPPNMHSTHLNCCRTKGRTNLRIFPSKSFISITRTVKQTSMLISKTYIQNRCLSARLSADLHDDAISFLCESSCARSSHAAS